MRNTKKQAFTLVELIVVITILAILGTIAFISYGSVTGTAKNSKVSENLANLSKKIEFEKSTGGKILSEFATGTLANNGVSGTWAWIALSSATYWVSTIDFNELKLNNNDFKDTSTATSRDYIYAYAGNKVYQVAWQIVDSETSAITAVIKWVYYKSSWSDVDWLISANGSTGALSNWDPLTSNINLY